ELEAISAYFQIVDYHDDFASYQRWGKIKLLNGRTLCSRLSDTQPGNKSNHFYRLFEAQDSKFGEALAFYEVKIIDKVHLIAVYQPLHNVIQTLGTVLRGNWSNEIKVLNISMVVDIIGIWSPSDDAKNIYILRKHPGLAHLNEEESGKNDGLDELEYGNNGKEVEEEK
ncbi:hypothetical protein BDQ12DRAFT_605726, partial [Crucibulum laeve]